MRFLRNPQSLKVVDEPIDGAADLYRGIPCESTSKIQTLEFDGIRNLMDSAMGADDAIVLGGIVTGRIHSIPTVLELVEGIMKDAEDIIKNLPKKVIK